MSKAMTQKEYSALQQNILENHSVCLGAGVTYFDSTYDYRTNTYFAVSLRGFCWQKVFHCQNDNKVLDKSLYESVCVFLEERSKVVWGG